MGKEEKETQRHELPEKQVRGSAPPLAGLVDSAS